MAREAQRSLTIQFSQPPPKMPQSAPSSTPLFFYSIINININININIVRQ